MGLLRLYLALSVMFAHFGFRSPIRTVEPGAAVYCFFVLSGFYISLALSDKYAGRSMIGTFYLNRALRLWPAYALGLLMLWPTGALEALGVYIREIDSLVGRAALVLANVSMIGMDVLFHVGARDGHFVFSEMGMDPKWNGSMWVLNPPVWSLSIEIVFYALAPFVVTSWRRTIAFVAIAFAYYLVLAKTHIAPKGLRYDLYFPYGMLYFGVGMMAFRLYRHQRSRRLLAWGVAALCAPLLWLVPLHLSSWLYLGTALAVVLLFDVTKSMPVDRFLGDLSYPIYILHYPIGRFVLWATGEDKPAAYMVLITIVVCSAVLVLFERPIDRWRGKLSRGRAAPAAPAA